MKSKLLISLISAVLLLTPNASFGETINLGTAANFVLFSTNGAVSNTGSTLLTGNVGTDHGSSTAFGNVDGVMHDQDGTSAQCATDLLAAYNQLNATIPTDFIAPLMGNGTTLFTGVYSVSGASTLDGELTLDAQNDPNAVFIFKLQGSLSTTAASKITLLNGALACNVFWKVEGLVSMATGTSMKGTVIANNAAIVVSTGSKLEGRALSTTGAITVDGFTATMPLGCGSVTLTGPAAPNLATTQCYGLFSTNGNVVNTGISTIRGDVGTNVTTTNGFDALKVSGNIHLIPDVSTAQCAADLTNVYTNLNTLTSNIELLYPQQFGHNLVLTPHVYYLNSAAVLTDSVFLNAQGNANAVFVIKINGALSTNTYSKVILINGTQSKNIYWVVNGAVSINNYSTFRGTLVCNNAAISFGFGATLDGRAMTTTGALSVSELTMTMPISCTVTSMETIDTNKALNSITISPNPISSNTTIVVNSNKINDYILKVYNVLGKEVINLALIQPTTVLDSRKLLTGMYFYNLTSKGRIIQSGKLISNQ
jgi:hypothetical protein